MGVFQGLFENYPIFTLNFQKYYCYAALIGKAKVEKSWKWVLLCIWEKGPPIIAELWVIMVEFTLKLHQHEKILLYMQPLHIGKEAVVHIVYIQFMRKVLGQMVYFLLHSRAVRILILH